MRRLGRATGTATATTSSAPATAPLGAGSDGSDGASTDGSDAAFARSPLGHHGAAASRRFSLARAPDPADEEHEYDGVDDAPLLARTWAADAEAPVAAVALAAAVAVSQESVQLGITRRRQRAVDTFVGCPTHRPWYADALTDLADGFQVQPPGLVVVHRFVAPQHEGDAGPAHGRRGAIRSAPRHDAASPLGRGPVQPLLRPMPAQCCTAGPPLEMIIDKVNDTTGGRFFVNKFYASGALLVARGLTGAADQLRRLTHLQLLPPPPPAPAPAPAPAPGPAPGPAEQPALDPGPVEQPAADPGAGPGGAGEQPAPQRPAPEQPAVPPIRIFPPPDGSGTDTAPATGRSPADVVREHREVGAGTPGSPLASPLHSPRGAAAASANQAQLPLPVATRLWYGSGLWDDLLQLPGMAGKVSVNADEQFATRPRVLVQVGAAAAGVTAAVLSAVLGAPLEAAVVAAAAVQAAEAASAFARAAEVTADVRNFGDAAARRLCQEAERLLTTGVDGEGLRACYPYDYLLEGADGVYERRIPPIAKHHSNPVEQRLLWRALRRPSECEDSDQLPLGAFTSELPRQSLRASRTTPITKPAAQRYVSAESGSAAPGLLRRHLDPLEDTAAGPFVFEKVCKGSKPWDQMLVRYPPTKGEFGQNSTGVADFEFDVFLREVAFSKHPSFNPATVPANEARRLAAEIADLHRRFQALQQQVPPAKEAAQRDHPLLPADRASRPGAEPPPLTRPAAERRTQGLLLQLSKVCAGGGCGPVARGAALRWRAGHLAREVAEGPRVDSCMSEPVLSTTAARALGAFLLWDCDMAHAVQSGGAVISDDDRDSATALWDIDTDKLPRLGRGAPAVRGIGCRSCAALLRWAAVERRQIAESARQRREAEAADGSGSTPASCDDWVTALDVDEEWWKGAEEARHEVVDVRGIRALHAVLLRHPSLSTGDPLTGLLSDTMASFGPTHSWLAGTLASSEGIVAEAPGQDADPVDIATYVCNQVMRVVNARAQEMRQYWDQLLPELQAVMEREAELAPPGGPLESLRDSLYEARAQLEGAEARELGLLREMLSLWHDLKAIPGYAMHVDGARLAFTNRTGSGTDYLAGPATRPSDRELLSHAPVWQPAAYRPLGSWGPVGGWRYRCRLSIHAGGSIAGVFETEERDLSTDARVTFNEAVRLYIPQEPQAVIIDVLQCSAYKRTVIGVAVIRPPFGRCQDPSSKSPCDWYQMESAAGGTAGVVIADAHWSQHDTARPSRAPVVTHDTVPDLHEVRRLAVQGLFDPLDPLNRTTIRRLAERFGASGAGVGAIAPPLDDFFEAADDDVALLADAARARRKRKQLRRDLLRRRWDLDCERPLELTGRDALLVGGSTRGVPFSPRAVDWPEATEPVPDAVAASAAARRGQNRSVADWAERIRRDRATLIKPRRTDHEILYDLVHQPPPLFEEGESCFSQLARFFQPITKLAPPRPPAAVDFSARESLQRGLCRARIQVHVVRALNLPTRTSEHLAPTGSGAESDSRETGDKVLVEVSFRGSALRPRTNLALARPTATFSETLYLEFNPPDDGGDLSKAFSEETLICITDPVEFSVYDWVRVDKEVKQSIAGTDIRAREDCRFIGRCSLPFYTLYHSFGGMWEGVLEIETPCLSLAYARQEDVAAKRGEAGVFEAPTLSVQVSLDPAIYSVPEPLELEPEGSDEELQIFQLARRWEVYCRNAVKGLADTPCGPEMRAVRVMALAPGDGQRAVLITRYVAAHGLPPPPSCLCEDDSAGAPSAVWACARFVSLIPYVVDIVACADRQRDVWHSAAQFLIQGKGDYEEHALLLANYFRWLARAGQAPFTDVKLVLGRANRYDEAMFVWTYKGGSFEEDHLWDPASGKRYPRLSCNLRDVSVIFDNQNVWCNMQPGTRPRDINWDLDNAACWNPLFPRDCRFECPVDNIHDAEEVWSSAGRQLYTPPDVERARELEQDLGSWVKEKLRELRRPDSRLRTPFHRYVGAGGEPALEELLLPAMEDAAAAGLEAGRADRLPSAHLPARLRGEDAAAMTLRESLLRAAQEIMFASTASPTDYFQVGVPLHLSWRDWDDQARAESFLHLSQLLETSHVHSTDPEQDAVTSFAVGIYVRPYECHVFSVWVFLACFRPRPGRAPGVDPPRRHRRFAP